MPLESTRPLSGLRMKKLNCSIFAYALTFEKVSDAVPNRISDAVAQKTGIGSGGDKT
jgi:hypothetical protein